MTVELAPHQLKAVKELHNGSILRGDVGTGKTRTALAYYLDCETKEDLYVITTAKKRDSLDWVGEAAAMGIGTRDDATLAGVLTVDSWNNISKYEHLQGCFVIFDEQRLVGSGAWVKSFYKIAKKNKWILLSATPGDTWIDYIPVFVANGFYKNKTEFQREHVIYNTFTKYPKVDRFVNVGKLVRLRNSLLVEMEYTRTTVRRSIDVECDFDKGLMEQVVKKRWNPYKNRPLRNAAEMFLTMRKVANSDPSRITAVQKILEKHPKVIVFYNFDYELEALRNLASIVPCELTENSITEKCSDCETNDTNKNSEKEGSIKCQTSCKISSTVLPLSNELCGIKSKKSQQEHGLILKSVDEELQASQPTKGKSALKDPWDGTIWSSSYQPTLPESRSVSGSGNSLTSTDPRMSVENQRAKYEYEKAMRKEFVGFRDATDNLTSASSKGVKGSRESRVGTNQRLGGVVTVGSGRTDAQNGVSKSSLPGTTGLYASTVEQNDQKSRETNQNLGGTKTAQAMVGDTNAHNGQVETHISPKRLQNVVIAEWNGHRHDAIPTTARWVYLVQYIAGAEGWNCVETDAMVFYSMTYSYRNFMQAHGRIDRLNTPFKELFYYRLFSKSFIDTAIWKAMKAKRNFNESKAVDIKWEKVNENLQQTG